MKELNVIQAIEMPIGTKFDLKYIEDYECKYVEVMAGIDEAKILCWNGDKNSIVQICASVSKMKLIPLQKPVSFIEAINNANNRIRVDLDDFEFSSQAKIDLNKYMRISKMFEKIRMHLSDYGISKAIKEGKWYIEESEELEDERLSK